MALVTVQNLTSSILSTDVGSLAPAETKSLQMGPEQAYRASEGLKALSDAGRVLVTISEETAKLDSLEPAQIATASVADGTVTEAKLAAGAVTTAKLGALAVDSAALAAGAVTAGKIATGGVSAAAQLAAGVVDTAALGAAAVQATKMAFFKSTEQTGTGAPQDIAHGLLTTPGLVMIVVTAVASATDALTEGAHDATNVKVTASTGMKFKVIAVK